MNDIKFSANIGKDGKMRFSNNLEFQQFLSNNKGKQVIISVNVIEEKNTPHQVSYYLNYILPKFQTLFYENGEILPLSKVDEKLREISVFGIKETFSFENFEYQKTLLTLDEIGKKRFSMFIDDLKRIATEEFFSYIE